MHVTAVEINTKNPCNPSPCGMNARCYVENGAGFCICITNYHGDPYIACRPECVFNNDCPKEKACINNICQNPCQGLCGKNSICRVINHTPKCSCPPSMTGNSFDACFEKDSCKRIDIHHEPLNIPQSKNFIS